MRAIVRRLQQRLVVILRFHLVAHRFGGQARMEQPVEPVGTEGERRG
jgi:hypothetical protein